MVSFRGRSPLAACRLVLKRRLVAELRSGTQRTVVGAWGFGRAVPTSAEVVSRSGRQRSGLAKFGERRQDWRRFCLRLSHGRRRASGDAHANVAHRAHDLGFLGPRLSV